MANIGVALQLSSLRRTDVRRTFQGLRALIVAILQRRLSFIH
jgi:hypothetical protein